MITPAAMDVLRRSPLFAGFSEEQLEMVPKVCIPHTFSDGDTIVAEGEASQSMWLIVEGSVEVLVHGACITRHGPGEHFGEMALLTSSPRSASVVASGDVTVLEISQRQLLGLISSEPAVALTMLGELAGRLRRATQALDAALEAHPDIAAVIEQRGVRVTRRESAEVLGPIEYSLHLGED